MFLGTPGFAVPALRAAAEACDVVAVVTRPDQPRGRGRVTAASEVSEAALALGLEVMKPERVGEGGTRGSLASLGADLFAVVAFGEILTPELLQVPRLGCINLHGSLLPELRGASPVQRALWEGRHATGVTTLWMDQGIDTGDLILQRWMAIEPADDAASLAGRLAEAGAPMLARSLVLAHEGRAARIPQDSAAGSYARKLAKRDGIVDWSLDAEAVWNRQRAVTPWPGAATRLRGRSLLLVETRPYHRLPVAAAPGTVVQIEPEGVVVACGVGALLLRRVKAEGRSELEAAVWAHGARIAPGDRLEGEARA